MIVCYIDGLCEPNPNGIATWGAIIRGHDGTNIFKSHGVIGVGKGMTNSVAEYVALVKVLTELWKKNMDKEEIIVYSDSEMVVGQMLGHMRANKGEYLGHYFEARGLQLVFTNLKFQWIPRLENKEADQLTRDAHERYCKVNGLMAKFNKRHKKAKRR